MRHQYKKPRAGLRPSQGALLESRGRPHRARPHPDDRGEGEGGQALRREDDHPGQARRPPCPPAGARRASPRTTSSTSCSSSAPRFADRPAATRASSGSGRGRATRPTWSTPEPRRSRARGEPARALPRPARGRRRPRRRVAAGGAAVRRPRAVPDRPAPRGLRPAVAVGPCGGGRRWRARHRGDRALPAGPGGVARAWGGDARGQDWDRFDRASGPKARFGSPERSGRPAARAGATPGRRSSSGRSKGSRSSSTPPRRAWRSGPRSRGCR